MPETKSKALLFCSSEDTQRRRGQRTVAGVQQYGESSDLLQDTLLIADRCLHDISPNPAPDRTGPENLNYCHRCQGRSRCSPDKPSQHTHLKQAEPRLDQPTASSLIHYSFPQTILSLILITLKKWPRTIWRCITLNSQFPAKRRKLQLWYLWKSDLFIRVEI